ncbi:MAG: hypothetical protein GX123_08035, partial [Clostridiales bacterium]|nr:hypothetical protein [Clostridiales bacterium]
MRPATGDQIAGSKRALRKLMEGKEQWEGRFGELAEALEEISAGVCSLNERDIFQSL